jgi:hypothetical protein
MPSTSIEHRAGDAAVFEATSPSGQYAVVFEDDGETGYFYGLDLSRPTDDPIVDALHLYSVSAVADRVHTYPIEIRWAVDRERAGLFIGGGCQAVFDFAERRAACRSGFPPPRGDFTATHQWDESLAEGL